MTPVDYDAEWKLLAEMLPEGWADKARTTGAISRARGISDPEQLLRLLLMHVATGLSLRQTVARAQWQGLAKISDVGLLDKLRRTDKWFAWMSGKLFERSRYRQAARSAVLKRRTVRALDATVIAEPGATGTDWRVHLSVSLPEMACDFYSVTDAKGGESFKRIPVSVGDIILGDRGYCHRAAVANLVRRRADVVVRLTHNSFPLQKKGGGRFDILKHLRKLNGFRPKAWAVEFVAHGKTYPARLCALRKTAEATALARAQLVKAARRKGKQVSERQLEAAAYIFVLTTLTREEYSVREVLELYRARWQVELVFKRLKSLLKLGHLAKSTDASARAWIQAKLLVALLTEEQMERAGLFSPWGHDDARPAEEATTAAIT